MARETLLEAMRGAAHIRNLFAANFTPDCPIVTGL
jgi:hypothetical protein